MKYAIQVMFDGAWMYVTEQDNEGNLQAKTYPSAEWAEEIAESWRLTGKESYVRVVTYEEDKQ